MTFAHLVGVVTEVTIAMTTVAAVDTVDMAVDATMIATALLAMMTEVMAVATIIALAALIAMLLDVTTAIAAVETTDAVDQIIMAERADGLVLAVMVMWHHQESLTVEVEAMTTVKIGTLAAR